MPHRPKTFLSIQGPPSPDQQSALPLTISHRTTCTPFILIKIIAMRLWMQHSSSRSLHLTHTQPKTIKQ